MRRHLAGALAVLVLPLAACSEDPYERYCSAVAEHQKALTEAVADGGPAALIEALPALSDLQDKAPRDITDEWQQLVGRVEGLDEALTDAGVDPATYDRKSPPEGLSDAEQARIAAAAEQLASPATAAAVAGLQQQARDVCKTPLTL